MPRFTVFITEFTRTHIYASPRPSNRGYSLKCPPKPVQGLIFLGHHTPMVHDLSPLISPGFRNTIYLMAKDIYVLVYGTFPRL